MTALEKAGRASSRLTAFWLQCEREQGREPESTGMKIELSASHVRRRAAELYAGESLPTSALTEGREVLKPEWWITNP